MRSVHHDAMVETILNTVEVEKHVRRALIVELLVEMSASHRFAPAKEYARVLLRRFDRGAVEEGELAAVIAELRACLHALDQV